MGPVFESYKECEFLRLNRQYTQRFLVLTPATSAVTGPEELSFAEVTAKIGAAIGRTLTLQTISDEEARQRYSLISGSVEETEAHVALWRAIRERRLAAVNNNVLRILGATGFRLR